MRWSATRWQIHGMNPGQVLIFDIDDYFNVKATVDRLNDAYIGELKWLKQRIKPQIRVTRIK